MSVRAFSQRVHFQPALPTQPAPAQWPDYAVQVTPYSSLMSKWSPPNQNPRPSRVLWTSYTQRSLGADPCRASASQTCRGSGPSRPVHPVPSLDRRRHLKVEQGMHLHTSAVTTRTCVRCRHLLQGLEFPHPPSPRARACDAPDSSVGPSCAAKAHGEARYPRCRQGLHRGEAPQPPAATMPIWTAGFTRVVDW